MRRSGRSAARTGVDFAASEHGRTQRAVLDRLGQGGRLAVAIGVAGAGKSTLLTPLVDAWHAEGWTVHGAALAWRQTDDLALAGIPEARRAALSVFLDRARAGQARTRPVTAWWWWTSWRCSARGSCWTCCGCRSGTGSGWWRWATPSSASRSRPGRWWIYCAGRSAPMPFLRSSPPCGSSTERERAASLLFRGGQAAEALALKREDGTARLVAGDYHQAVAGIADLWQERRTANVHDPELQSERERADEPGRAGDRRAPSATHRRPSGRAGAGRGGAVGLRPGRPTAYDLPLAVGDRVRLFARTNAAYADKSRGILGNNGSVLEVRGDQRRRGHLAQRAGAGRAGRLGHAAGPGERAHSPRLRRRADDRRDAGADQHGAHRGHAGGHAGGERLQGLHGRQPAPAGDLSRRGRGGGAARDRRAASAWATRG